MNEMANVNKVILIGRLTRDPELRFTPQGTPVCDLSLAINRVTRNPDGTQREETSFIDVTVWGRQAETTAQYLKKGREAFVEGRLTQERWENPEGQKRSKLKVTAERIQFLGGGGGAAGRGAPPSDDSPADVPADSPPPDAGAEDLPF
jgi:single-strand DNA-binding protein